VLKTALPASMTPELNAALNSQRMNRKVTVYTSDRISTPLTYGMIRPRIVLPSSMKLSLQELNFIMAHECGHVKRRRVKEVRFAACRLPALVQSPGLAHVLRVQA
jgi:beta-lactamase regulating signal transducer with metallopeptidase domain